MKKKISRKKEQQLRTQKKAATTSPPSPANKISAIQKELAALQSEAAELRRELASQNTTWQQRLAHAESLHGSQLRERERQFQERQARHETGWERARFNQRLREFARAILPTGARVMVVSKGDDELLRLDGRFGWHFPQTSGGVYAGHHPADSTEAIAHLETLKAQGGAYLLIPIWAFWWLDFYADFCSHLESNYRVLAYDAETCVIYTLLPQADGQSGKPVIPIRAVNRPATKAVPISAMSPAPPAVATTPTAATPVAASLAVSGGDFAIPRTRTILFSGHDLKFIRAFVAHCERDARYHVLLDEHQGHRISDPAKSLALLPAADVIFCEWCLGNAKFYSERKRPGQRLVIRVHHQEMEYAWRHELVWENVDAIVFTNFHHYDRFCREQPEQRGKAVVIYCDVDCGALDRPKLPEAQFNLGLVGFNPMRKRPDLAFEILAKLRQTDSRYTLFFKTRMPWDYKWLWDRPQERNYYERFLAMVEASSHRNSVVIDAHGDDMPLWYSKIGFILSTSDHEGTHQAVAEGMASGCIPIIRNWNGASPLYPARFLFSSVDKAVDLIRKFQTPRLCAAATTEVKAHAREHFNQRRIFEQIEALFQDQKGLSRAGAPGLDHGSTDSQSAALRSANPEPAAHAGALRTTRVLLYGDVDMNLIDGSSIWLASLAEVLGGIKTVSVTVLLKTPIKRDLVVRSAAALPEVRFLDPWALAAKNAEVKEALSKNPASRLSPEIAAKLLMLLDREQCFDVVVVRGIDVTLNLADETCLAPRLWAYITDPLRHAAPAERAKLTRIVERCGKIVCQTEEAKAALTTLLDRVPDEKAILLPPMIPEMAGGASPALNGTAPRLGYSGKFSPPYMILETLDAFEKIRAHIPGAEFHVIGDKFHNLPPVKNFVETVTQRLSKTPGVFWHGGVSRAEANEILSRAHVAASWRSPAFDDNVELSTKILEYAALGIPVLLNPTPLQRRVFGPDYPAYVSTEAEFIERFLNLAKSPALYRQVSKRLRATAAEFTFASNRRRLGREVTHRTTPG